jgi:hypothetical protein
MGGSTTSSSTAGACTPDVVFGGGRLLSAPESFWRQLSAAVRERCPGVAVSLPARTPAAGAAIMAAFADGCRPVVFFGREQEG